MERRTKGQKAKRLSEENDPSLAKCLTDKAHALMHTAQAAVESSPRLSLPC